MCGIKIQCELGVLTFIIMENHKSISKSLKYGITQLPPPIPFSRGESKTIAAHAPTLTGLFDANTVLLRNLNSKSSYNLRQAPQAASDQNIFEHRKVHIQSKNMSKGMPCLREIRSHYNKSIAASLQVEAITENPEYDTLFKKLFLSSDISESSTVIMDCDIACSKPGTDQKY